jgi:AraC-like DNA-binding protein
LHTPSPLHYTEQPPPVDLAPWVASFWRITGEVEPGRPVAHRILPDGCADIVFDLERARRSAGRSGDLIGPATTALVVTLAGPIDYLGVRFRPGVLGALAGIPAEQLRDCHCSDSDPEFPLAVGAGQLVSVPCIERVPLLIAACRRRIGSLARPDPLVRWAIEAWQGPTPGSYRHVSAVARDLALSERAFERRFVSQVGLTPVQFRRVARFRSVMRRHGAGMRQWAALAALEGFSDQAHLSREFQHLSGLTPGAWARAQESDAGFLQDSGVTTI